MLSEFFTRRGHELWPWGWRQQRPRKGSECVCLMDCLGQFSHGESNFLKKWILIYMQDFFDQEDSLPELDQLFGMRPPRLQMLLNFFVHHGGCLTNKFLYEK